MPQLDIASYFSQIFWFLIIFSIFYFIFFNKVVSFFGSSIKIRTKKLNKSVQSVENFKKESESFFTNYNALFNNSVQVSASSFGKAFTSLNSSLKKEEIDCLNLKKGNPSFLKNAGSTVALKQLIIKYLLLLRF
jgi:F-type H+-transporting ATPase subunit b